MREEDEGWGVGRVRVGTMCGKYEGGERIRIRMRGEGGGEESKWGRIRERSRGQREMR